MKYFIKPQEKIELGSKRKRYSFLFLPKKIGDEIRWLEWAGWVEVAKFNCRRLKPLQYENSHLITWKPERWINK